MGDLPSQDPTRRSSALGPASPTFQRCSKLHQRRAFKFCFDDERLRALKREVTLVRLLRSALGERDDIVHIHELKLDAPPFYLESDLAPHGNLLQWAESQGGLEKIPLAQRIALVAHTATALAAAHSIGVLHKDIKPTNILIFDGPGGEPRPRLVDFGIGTLADPAVLGEHGVTAAGFTRTKIEHSTGTPTYSPPEYLAGKPYTIQGDIYGLGVLLYQLATNKPNEPLAPGWERDIADPLLREDIANCVDGDPARRFSSASQFADQLHTLSQRQSDFAEEQDLRIEKNENIRSGQRLICCAILIWVAGLVITFVGISQMEKLEPIFCIIPFAFGWMVSLLLSVVGIVLLSFGLGYNLPIRVFLIIIVPLLLILVPPAGLIALSVLSGKATAILRAAGYKVGFLGASRLPTTCYER